MQLNSPTAALQRGGLYDSVLPGCEERLAKGNQLLWKSLSSQICVNFCIFLFFFLTDFKRLEYSCTSPAVKPFLLHGIASAEPNSSGFHTFSTTYVVSLQKLTDVQQEKPTCIHLAGRRDTCSALGQAKQIPYEIPGLYFQSKDLYQELHHPIILKHMSSVSEWVSSEVTDCSHFQAL